MLESFARCPKCGRNDKVEKITAILRSHGHDSSIAQSLASPRRPAFKPKPETLPKQENQPKPVVKLKLTLMEKIKKTSLLISGIILLGIFIFIFVLSIDFLTDGIVGLFITLLIISIFPLIGGIKLLRKRSAFIKIEKLKVYKAWKEENTRNQEQWQVQLKRWEKLYFCHRDDIVFIPGEGTFAPVEKMKEYLNVEEN